MTDSVVKVMVEVLQILAIMTKEIKQSRISELITWRRIYCLPSRLIISQKLLGRSWLEKLPLRMHCKSSKQ